MIKKILCIVLIIMSIFMLTGCWSKTEPKELAIVISVIYDTGQNKKQSIYVEMLDTNAKGQSSATASASSKVVKLEADTISEGIRDTRITIDKLIYGSHNKARIFTERMAKEGVIDILDFFLRDHLTDERPYMLVVKNEDPMDLYRADKGLSDSLGSYIDDLANTRKETSEYSVFTQTLDFYKDYYSEGRQPVMGVIEAVLDETYLTPEESGDSKAPKYILELNGLAVFKEDKLVGYLDKTETKIYNYLNSKIKSAYISIPIGDKFITVNCIKTDTKVKSSFSEGVASFEVIINKELMVVENQTEYNITDKKEVNIVENIINNMIEQEVKATISKVKQKYKSDIFGFGEYFHRQNPEIWKLIKSKWDDEFFVNSDMKITVKSKIHYEGESREKFGEKADESI